MKKATSCQFCGAQSTTLEAYFDWTVCSGCAATLRTPQSARASAAEEPRRSTRRKRCGRCCELHERNKLYEFIGNLNNQTHQRYNGKLLCERCHERMWIRCAHCRQFGVYTESWRPGQELCSSCTADFFARQERQREQCRCTKCGRVGLLINGRCAQCIFGAFAATLGTVAAPEHAQRLAEYAGERLEWPCSKEELKRVWRSAARRTHPDTGGSPEAFRAAKASYDALAEVAR